MITLLSEVAQCYAWTPGGRFVYWYDLDSRDGEPRSQRIAADLFETWVDVMFAVPWPADRELGENERLYTRAELIAALAE